MKFFSHVSGAQLARFCVVGGTCFVFNILSLAALHEGLGLHYVPAFVIVFLAGNALGFWLNQRFTFGLPASIDHSAMGRYLAVNVLALFISTAAIYVLVEWFHVWYLAATIIVAALLAPMTFVFHKLLTYRLHLSKA